MYHWPEKSTLKFCHCRDTNGRQNCINSRKKWNIMFPAIYSLSTDFFYRKCQNVKSERHIVFLSADKDKDWKSTATFDRFCLANISAHQRAKNSATALVFPHVVQIHQLISNHINKRGNNICPSMSRFAKYFADFTKTNWLQFLPFAGFCQQISENNSCGKYNPFIDGPKVWPKATTTVHTSFEHIYIYMLSILSAQPGRLWSEIDL